MCLFSYARMDIGLRSDVSPPFCFVFLSSTVMSGYLSWVCSACALHSLWWIFGMCHVPFAFGFLISLAKIVLPRFPSLGFRLVFDLVFYRCLSSLWGCFLPRW